MNYIKKNYFEKYYYITLILLIRLPTTTTWPNDPLFQTCEQFQRWPIQTQILLVCDKTKKCTQNGPLPLNWNWHSCSPRMWPFPRAAKASGDSTHNCRWTRDNPGTRPHSNDAKLQTTLKAHHSTRISNCIVFRKFGFYSVILIRLSNWICLFLCNIKYNSRFKRPAGYLPHI